MAGRPEMSSVDKQVGDLRSRGLGAEPLSGESGSDALAKHSMGSSLPALGAAAPGAGAVPEAAAAAAHAVQQAASTLAGAAKAAAGVGDSYRQAGGR